MWQVALAAAVAGSGFFAKRFLTSNVDPSIVPEQIEENSDHLIDQQRQLQQQQYFDTFKLHSSVSPVFQARGCYNFPEAEARVAVDANGDGSMFRSLSSEFRIGTGSQLGSKKNANKKLGNGYGGDGRNAEGFTKKCGIVVDQSKYRRKFAVCVKKRRTSKNAPGKCDSCSSKGNSTFGWGIGVGMMYMMSAGTAEISRLNAAMDETAKVVHELKSELSKRKSSYNLQVSSSKTEINTTFEKTGCKNTQLLPCLSAEIGYNAHNNSKRVIEEGECESSVLTEEPQREVLEMKLLEAELESELQKLSWCSPDASGLEERMLDGYENGASTDGFYERDGDVFNSYQVNAVVPSELNQKLCHLLIKQQEGQIVDLESELHQAQSELYEKEAELQALKDCVRRLSEFSIATASDEETETQVEEEKTNDYGNKNGGESKRPVVGMKRTMDFKSYSCHI